MSVPTNAILRVVFQILLPDNVIAQNVFYALFANDGGSDDEDDVVDDLVDWMSDLYDSLDGGMPDSITIQETIAYVRDLVGDDWDEIGTGVPDLTFASASTMAPHGIAALQHARSTDPDVSGHKYYPGLPDTSVIDSDISSGYLASIVIAGAVWVANFVGATTGSGFFPGVWSPTRDAFYQFNGVFITNAQVAYQRRRKPGVGI